MSRMALNWAAGKGRRPGRGFPGQQGAVMPRAIRIQREGRAGAAVGKGWAVTCRRPATPPERQQKARPGLHPSSTAGRRVGAFRRQPASRRSRKRKFRAGLAEMSKAPGRNSKNVPAQAGADLMDHSRGRCGRRPAGPRLHRRAAVPPWRPGFNSLRESVVRRQAAGRPRDAQPHDALPRRVFRSAAARYGAGEGGRRRREACTAASRRATWQRRQDQQEKAGEQGKTVAARPAGRRRRQAEAEQHGAASPPAPTEQARRQRHQTPAIVE